MSHFILILFCCILSLPALAQRDRATSAATQDSSIAVLEGEIIRLVNKHRASLNLPPLQPDSVLSALARTHSRNMASRKVPFEHVGFNNRETAYKKAKRLAFVGAFAENIAEGPDTAEEVLELWLTSEGHKRNIEGAYQYIGVGVAAAEGGDLYFTQLFSGS